MPNVSVSNTPGLYIGSGASAVLNNAQQLYTLLSNSGNVNFELSAGNSTVFAYFIGNAAGSYGNTNVAAYLPTYTGSLDNSSSIVALYANAATQQQQITNIITNANANTAAYLLTATGNIGSVGSRPNYSYANFFVGDGSQLVNLPMVPTTYSNANVALYLPTYTGTLENSSSIIFLNANVDAANIAIGQVQSNLSDFSSYANATFSSSTYGNANVAAYLPTYSGTLDNSITIINLVSNAATQATAINTLNANLGAFETYANATFGISNYGNANVAAYLPAYGGAIQVLSLTGVVGQDITIEPDGANDVSLNADTIKIGDNNQDATIVTRGTGNLQLRTHSGSSTEGNITLQHGANGNIKLWPNGSGVVEAAGNVKANYYLGDGSQLINLPVQTGTYSNTNVAAYLPTYTGTLAQSSTITDLYSNAAIQATAIDTINANLGAYQTYANANVSSLQNQITGANTNIQTFNANLGAYQTFANANVSSLQNQITGANTNIQTFNANLGAFQTYANATFGTGTYGNTQMLANLAANSTQTSAWSMPFGANSARPANPIHGMFRYNTERELPEWYSNIGSVWVPFSTVAPSSATTYNMWYLAVGGGGSGGSRIGAGGGAGGANHGNVSITSSQVYTITVGAGGASVASTPGNTGNDGANTTISGSGITTINGVGGGGGGAYIGTNGTAGRNGGSGGGGSYSGNGGVNTAGSGTSGQGSAGGAGSATNVSGGGGGGAGAAGQAAQASAGGAGGAGAYYQITGANVAYAGGGGGSQASTAGSGGAGGGGAGATGNNDATAGTNYLGGGGGGARNDSDTSGVDSGKGGDGVAIIRVANVNYSGSYTGSNVVVSYSGTDTILKFSASGTYTA
jgi:fibronectin-binding autotransporter adhesin